jgi:AhpD family alkylhydroperoxidase
MRDERNGLSEHFKYRLALVASHENNCPYCVSHHACTLMRRWGYNDEGLEKVLADEPPADELRARLAEHFTPQEVMEIVLVDGFLRRCIT